MSTNTDLSHDFAQSIARSRFEDLQPDAVEGAKKSILDTLGVIMAASSVEPAIRGVHQLVLEAGGSPQSSLLGFGGKAPAVMAAFLNGAMAHCLDFDDHAPEGHHPSSSIVPAAFAVAERAGGVKGHDMLAAVAAGQDMFLRMRRNVEWKQDWHLTTVIGVFSAAAASARAIGLDTEQIVSAIGIAGMQSCGTMELAYGVGSDLRGMYAGFSSKGATLATLMAEQGIAGTRSMFEGKAGLFNTYFDGQYDREAMVKDLGKVYTGGSILYKPWPSCGASHGYIQATLELMKDKKLTVQDIRQIRVFVGDFQSRLCLPLESRQRPATFADAKFSIPFVVGLAATRGAVKVVDFTGDTLTDPAVLAAAAKVVAVVDNSFDWKGKLPEGRIEIDLHNGQTFSRLGDDVPGSLEAPMSWDYVYQKFSDAASLAVRAPSSQQLRQAYELVRDLENVEDATAVMRLLAT